MRIVRVIIPLAVGLVLLAACGGDEASESGQPADTAIDVIATEYAFDPDAWSVPSGEEITVAMDNQGTLEHEWVLLTEGTEIESSREFEESMVEFEIEAPSSGQADGAFTAPATGDYEVICAIPGHLEEGMRGTLTVTEPAS